MDPLALSSALIESQARERALMSELEAAKIALVHAEGAKREALVKEEAANREKDALTLLAESQRRELEALRASTASTEEAVMRALDAQKERLEREAAKSLALAQYERDQRSIWLRSPEAVLTVLTITAQNGYGAGGFRNLSRAFRYDEQLWDAIKDSGGYEGVTFLMLACWKGDLERVRFLLARSANVKYHTIHPFFDVMDDVPLELKEVIDEYYDSMSALSFACHSGHADIVQLLINKGALDVTYDSSFHEYNALKMACKQGHVAVVKLLLDKEECTDIDFAYNRDNSSGPPLLVAMVNGHFDVAYHLIDRGAQIDAVVENGVFPLSIAASGKCPAVFHLLLEKGADVNLGCEYGLQTALMAACEHGNLEAAQCLLDKGANVNYSSSYESGYTSLMYASEKGHLSIVQLLLEKGANKQPRTEENKTAFDLAMTAEIRKALA